MELLANILSWLSNLSFYVTINPDQQGVFVRGGRYLKTLHEGFYFKWPIYDTVWDIKVKEQCKDLPNQTVTDKSGQTWAISCTLRYEIEDAKKAMLDVHDYDQSLQNYTTSLICSTACRMKELKYDKLIEDVTEDLVNEAEGWGVNIIELNINIFAQVKAYVILGGNGTIIEE